MYSQTAVEYRAVSNYLYSQIDTRSAYLIVYMPDGGPWEAWWEHTLPASPQDMK